MSDRLFAECCLGSETQHALWERCSASADERPKGQDPKGLEAKPASAVGAAETPKTPLSHAEAKQPALSTGLSSSSPGDSPTSIEGASK